MDQVENKQGEHKGTWVAAVGGAGVGASAAAAGGFALKAQGGIKGVVADTVHEVMDHFKSPEKLEKYVKNNFEAIQSKIGILESGLNHPQVQGRMRDSLPNVKDVLSVFKEAKFEEIAAHPRFKESMQQLSKDSEKFREVLNSAGLKRSFVSRIPGGIASLATVGGVIGAAMAFHVIDGIHESIDRQGQGGGRAVQ